MLESLARCREPAVVAAEESAVPASQREDASLVDAKADYMAAVHTKEEVHMMAEAVHKPAADYKEEVHTLAEAVRTAAVAARKLEAVRMMVALGAALTDPAPIAQKISGRQTTP